MTVSTPYSGSLLRLALTTIAITALFAGVFTYWQGYGAHSRAVARHVPAILR